MNTRPPRFSVVIPTADRAHLLPGAIASALAQSETDLEVIVADNGSTDDTALVAGAAGDERVRYVRRGKRHPMHESWRYALAQARGDFVTVLCDDDALHPRALEYAAATAQREGAEVVSWRVCTHYADAWPGPQRGRVHFGPPYADRPFRVDAARLLDLAFEMRVAFSDLVPKLLNAIVARSALDRIAAKRGTLFPPTACPDYSAMLGLAARARGIVLLDTPLTVAGAGPDSIGASAYRRGEAARSFLAELIAGAPDLVRPAAVGPRITWLAQTLMQCAQDDYIFAGRVVDPVNLYGLAGLEIAQAERDEFDVAQERTDYEAALAGPLAANAGAIRSFVTGRRMIACESFLAPIPDGETILGLGAFRVADAPGPVIAACAVDDARGAGDAGHAGGDGAPRTAEVAAGLDAWLSREADRLSPALAAHRARCGDRHMVLFGLGANGRALRRVWRDGRSAAVVDDHADRAPEGVDRLRAEDLDPRRHFVVVTPADADAIVGRLQAAGFVPDADVVTLGRAKPSASSAMTSIVRGAGDRAPR